ncbi:MAG TPA: fumarylacetoacetate hydrolase family protein [Terriglobia bacterium]|nr:fumarylacetoacetate hydrolase family protein [Terriglobia bacterium]
MKLVAYESGTQPALGVVVNDWIIGVSPAIELVKKKRVPRQLAQRANFKNASQRVADAGATPKDMIELLGRGQSWGKSLAVVTSALAKEIDPKKAPRGLFTPLAKTWLLAPIPKPGKITCVGLNYADHAREQGHEPPKAPIFFLKSGNTICGPGDAIHLPPNSTQVDYEAEFAVVIGKKGSRIPEEKAYDYVAGYTILHDVSARDLQFSDGQWYRGKSCDTFAPTGPWIVTKDEIKDPHKLRISLTLNGETMQDSNTSNLIFSVPYLISYLSQSLTWEVGDLISTGTPPGVGVFRKPQVFLKAGDTTSVTVEGLGVLTNPVVGP